jgi:hypothetical protein
MSRGPGRVERTIRTLFDAHPDEAFTADDLCRACYPGARPIRHKHRVAVWRAAHNVLKDDPDWANRVSPLDRRKLVICNQASVPSMIMRHKLCGAFHSPTHDEALERTREVLAAGPLKPEDDAISPRDADRYVETQRRKAKGSAERAVRDHVTLRDADPAERERLKAEQQVHREAQLAALAQSIRSHHAGVKVLSTATGCTSTTHTKLAALARRLMVENDPDAIRAGLAEIATALDGMGHP